MSGHPSARALTALLALLILLASVAACGGAPAHAPKVGEPAPELALRLLDGSETSVSQLRGRALVLNFWATYCPPCRAELPALNSFSHTLNPNEAMIVAVDQREDERTVRQYMVNQALTLPVALDEQGAGAQAYLLQYIPTTFFIDKEGIIRHIKVGPVNELELRNRLHELR